MAFILDGIEKLINEHGSSVILKERIALAREQYAALERKVIELERKVSELKAENEGLRIDIIQVNEEKRVCQDHLEFFHNTNPNGYVCDHCGSPSLKRTGNRLHQDFGVLGTKEALFTCESCGKESAFLQ